MPKITPQDVVFIRMDGSKIEGAFDSPVAWKIDLPGKEDACPIVVGRYFRGVKNGPSPDWLQQRLKVAEQILRWYDMPEPEVWVDVELLAIEPSDLPLPSRLSAAERS